MARPPRASPKLLCKSLPSWGFSTTWTKTGSFTPATLLIPSLTLTRAVVILSSTFCLKSPAAHWAWAKAKDDSWNDEPIRFFVCDWGAVNAFQWVQCLLGMFISPDNETISSIVHKWGTRLPLQAHAQAHYALHHIFLFHSPNIRRYKPRKFFSASVAFVHWEHRPSSWGENALNLTNPTKQQKYEVLCECVWGGYMHYLRAVTNYCGKKWVPCSVWAIVSE